MAFALTAKDNIGSGIAILIAMVVRVVPMKLGYAQILSKSGLSYLQEHLFTTLATSVILVGAFIGLLADLEPYKAQRLKCIIQNSLRLCQILLTRSNLIS